MTLCCEEGAERFRRVLGHHPTGVSVVTSVADGEPVGFAVGSLFSVSLDPPLVGFCSARSSTTWPRVRAGGSFCANVLAGDQEDICQRFARSGGGKFDGLAWAPAPSGSPILAGALAWIDCHLEWVTDVGDHELAIASVTDLDSSRSSSPLVFFRGAYHGLAV